MRQGGSFAENSAVVEEDGGVFILEDGLLDSLTGDAGSPVECRDCKGMLEYI